MKLTNTTCYTRWPCTICGGCTEKVAILCEDTNNPQNVRVRLCECCLERSEQERDELLQKHIAGLVRRVEYLKFLSVVVPTYNEWQVAEFLHDHAMGEAGAIDAERNTAIDRGRDRPGVTDLSEFQARTDAVWSKYDAQIAKINDAVERRANGQSTEDYEEWFDAVAQGRDDLLKELYRIAAGEHVLQELRRDLPAWAK